MTGRTGVELPAIEVPDVSEWPAAVAAWQHTGASGQLEARIDLVRGSGRRGAVPELELRYAGGQGNGPFGIGWTLGVPSIVRGNGRRLPRYRDEGPEADAFASSELGELVPALVRGPSGAWESERVTDETWLTQRFRARHEGAFVRVERRVERATGAVHWRLISRDNVTRIFGRSPEARIADPANPRRVAQWLLEEEWDSSGNGVRFEYKREDRSGVAPSTLYEAHRVASALPDAALYPKRMKWGNRRPSAGDDGWLFELVFDYGEHDALEPQPAEQQPWSLRSDSFSQYRTGFELRTRRLCRRVLLFHHMPELGGPRLVRAHELRYEAISGSHVLSAVRLAGLRRLDNGVVVEEALPETQFEYAPVLAPGPVRELRCRDGIAGAGAVAAQMSWLDLENNGLPGLVTRDSGGAVSYRANLGNGLLDQPVRLPSRPSLTDTSAPGAQDIGKPFGDARSCLVDLLRGPGFQERLQGGTWTHYRPFRSTPTVRSSTAGTRNVDLDGDGLPDLMLTGPNGLRCHSFSGRTGWAAAQEVSAPPSVQMALADRTGTVSMADMSGDGLADLVQVRPGRVRYWPNLGHGVFGEPVEMSGSPLLERPDLFDPKRVRLADVRGSGVADLIYLGREGVVWYANQNGNGFGPGQRLTHLPPLTDQESIDVVDLLGNATGCLVWSSVCPGQSARPLRYAELQPGVPARTLLQVRNGMGLEASIDYAPSTRLMQEDRAAGRPWRGASPSPTWVVTELRELDRVSGVTRLSSWRYRHAHFDEAERENAGFAYVEQREQTLFPADPVEGAPSANPPPRETRTWFHPGMPDGHAALEGWMQREFFAADTSREARPELEIDNVAGATSVYLLRALRGQPLRQEVYEIGGADAGAVPLAVTEFGYLIRALQPGVERAERIDSVPPVVASFRREELERVYEAQVDDPRVKQELALAIDGYGNVLQSVELAYPRRVPVEPEQARLRAHATQREFVNDDRHLDWYRVGTAVSETSWELGSIPPPAGAGLARSSELQRWLHESESHELPHGHDPLPLTGPVCRRLIGGSRIRYWSDDLASELPLGEVGRRALVHHECRAAFSDAFLEGVFGAGTLAPSALETNGYEHDADYWWARGPVVRYEANAFFQPISSRSFRGGEQSLEYDVHQLLVQRAVDPAGNAMQALPDYQALAPHAVIDPNGTRTSVAFDALGLATAVAVAGPDGEGDTLADPTTRVTRELGHSEARGSPASLRVSSRARHRDPTTRWQETITFFDGWAAALQRKELAEPDPTTGAERWVLSSFALKTAGGATAREYAASFVSHGRFSGETTLDRPILQRTQHDALGRPTRERRADGAVAKTRHTAWLVERWDFNDAVRESDWLAERRREEASAGERDEATAAEAHADTPNRDHLDPSGRVFLQVMGGGTLGPIPHRLDLRSGDDPVAVIDARGIRTEERVYDLLGRTLRVRSVASGETKTLFDAEDQPVMLWGARGQRQVLSRDPAGRLTTREIQKSDGTRRIAELLVWGETSGPESSHRRGRPYLHYDASGEQKSVAYDFKGNLTQLERTLRQDFTIPADWSPLLGATDIPDLERRARTLLASDRRFVFRTEYDADGRILSRTLPDGSRLDNDYRARGLLASSSATIDGTTTRALESADYDAEGRIRTARLGNGVTERTDFDPRSGFLTTQRTLDRDGEALRDLRIGRDAAGNVLRVDDRSQQTRYFGGSEVSARRAFTYDSLYRLTSASGREADMPVGPLDRETEPVLAPLPHPADRARVRPFTEEYRYDAAGNMTELSHAAGPTGSFTQRFDIDPRADRVTALRDRHGNPVPGRFTYDEAGNPRELGGLSGLVWDEDERLVRVDLGGGGIAHYVYDSSGARVCKLIVRLGGMREEHVNLGDFEIQRRLSAGGTVERETTTVHVATEAGRLAVIERRTDRVAGTSLRTWRYQHHDQVGSTGLETDENGEVLSFEEYRPFGTIAYQAAKPTALPKRFRFGGQERDSETGFGCFEARYYAAWLCRWVSPDPAGMADGTNRYAYCANNPISRHDPDGTQSVFGYSDDVVRYLWPSGFPTPPSNDACRPPECSRIRTPDGISIPRLLEALGPGPQPPPVGLHLGSTPRQPSHERQRSVRTAPRHETASEASTSTSGSHQVAVPRSPRTALDINPSNLSPVEAERWASQLPPLPTPASRPSHDAPGSSVGAPGFFESLIPIWGAGRESVNHFQLGNPVRGVVYGALAISDVFLVKALVVGAARLGVRAAIGVGRFVARSVGAEATRDALRQTVANGVREATLTTVTHASRAEREAVARELATLAEHPTVPPRASAVPSRVRPSTGSSPAHTSGGVPPPPNHPVSGGPSTHPSNAAPPPGGPPPPVPGAAGPPGGSPPSGPRRWSSPEADLLADAAAGRPQGLLFGEAVDFPLSGRIGATDYLGDAIEIALRSRTTIFGSRNASLRAALTNRPTYERFYRPIPGYRYFGLGLTEVHFYVPIATNHGVVVFRLRTSLRTLNSAEADAVLRLPSLFFGQ